MYTLVFSNSIDYVHSRFKTMTLNDSHEWAKKNSIWIYTNKIKKEKNNTDVAEINWWVTFHLMQLNHLQKHNHDDVYCKQSQNQFDGLRRAHHKSELAYDFLCIWVCKSIFCSVSCLWLILCVCVSVLFRTRHLTFKYLQCFGMLKSFLWCNKYARDYCE